MGEGSDIGYEDQPSQGSGEYFAPAGMVPVQGAWGPPEGVQPAGVWGPPSAPQYAQPAPQYQHPQPPAEYRPGPSGYAPAPPVQQRMLRRRKVSKGMERMYLIQAFEELLSAPVFNDPSDPYATKVQEELFGWAQRRVDELLGEVPEKGTTAGLTPSEVLFLKAFVERMSEPEGQEVSPQPQEAAAAPNAPTPPPAAAPALQSLQPPVQDLLQRPAPPPVQVQPARPPPAGGPHVVTRPTAAQREALAQRRMRPPAAPLPPPVPVQPPQYAPPAPVQYAPVPAPPRRHMTPPEPAPVRRGRRKSTPEPSAPAGPPPKPLPPPPMRYAMPQGQGMTAVSAMRAQEQIESGGTVLSQTFVKSA